MSVEHVNPGNGKDRRNKEEDARGGGPDWRPQARVEALGGDDRARDSPITWGRHGCPNLASDLTHLFPDGDPDVLDVGAYTGEFAALIHAAFPGARVWCFEPFPESCERLRTRFSGADWVTIENVGLSDRTGTADLIVGDDRSTNSIVSPVVRNGVFEAGTLRVPVRLDTLSNCTERALGPQAAVGILKVDTEGHDLAVLRGGEPLLRGGRIEAVHVEVMFIEHFKGAAGFIEMCQYLQEFGYRLFSLYDLKRNPQGQLRYGNALFLSPRRQAFAGIAR
jgi:FkbM family methyltransferase